MCHNKSITKIVKILITDRNFGAYLNYIFKQMILQTGLFGLDIEHNFKHLNKCQKGKPIDYVFKRPTKHLLTVKENVKNSVSQITV